jgi:3',5'-cyclic AMP phosphodiesterase CpdA
MDVLAAIVADLRAQAPDHIAMTGDILNIGLPAEFPLAADWLKTLGEAQGVSFVPGNHDAYVPSAMPFIAKTFAPWMAGDETRADAFPYLRQRGDVAIIGLTSGVPTAPLLANGRLGAAQRARFAQMLDDTRGLMRVVMIHHPPHTSGAVPGTERHRAAWHLYEITREDARWRIEGVIRGMRLDGNGVIEVGRFSL